MATVDISESSTLTPAQAWALASDLRRFDEWLTIFGGWRGPVPAEVAAGTKVSSLIKVKGFRNVIHWEVTRYEEPRRIGLHGHGRGGVQLELDMTVADDPRGSTFHLVAQLRGGLLSGPVGRIVAKVLQADVRRSVRKLATLSPAGSERR